MTWPRRRVGPATALVLALLCLPFPARATDVQGEISVDTHWTPAGNPYHLVGSLSIDQGATLTIDPGVVVRGAPGQTIQVGSASLGPGLVKADAIAGSPIVFASDGDPRVLRGWEGFRFVDASPGSIFRNCRFENAYVGLWLNASPGIAGCTFLKCVQGINYGNAQAAAPDVPLEVINCQFDSCTSGIDHRPASPHTLLVSGSAFTSNTFKAADLGSRCTFRACTFSFNKGEAAISGGNSDLHLQCTTFSQNSAPCVDLFADGKLSMTGANFEGNLGYNIHYSGTTTLFLADVWWGTPDSTAAKSSIYDCYYTPFVGYIWISPVAQQPWDPINCLASPVQRTTWGSLRRVYR